MLTREDTVPVLIGGAIGAFGGVLFLFYWLSREGTFDESPRPPSP